jgi:hypothetical protein
MGNESNRRFAIFWVSRQPLAMESSASDAGKQSELQ